MDDDEICEEILGMIIGGHETIATALTWLWYGLGRHPAVEAKMLEEIGLVVFSRYSIQRLPDFWESPDTFDPSRFDPSNTRNPGTACAHVPFGRGLRICIGSHFAMMEMLVIAVTLMRRFQVSADPTDRHCMSA